MSVTRRFFLCGVAALPVATVFQKQLPAPSVPAVRGAVPVVDLPLVTTREAATRMMKFELSWKPSGNPEIVEYLIQAGDRPPVSVPGDATRCSLDLDDVPLGVAVPLRVRAVCAKPLPASAWSEGA